MQDENDGLTPNQTGPSGSKQNDYRALRATQAEVTAASQTPVPAKDKNENDGLTPSQAGPSGTKQNDYRVLRAAQAEVTTASQTPVPAKDKNENESDAKKELLLRQGEDPNSISIEELNARKVDRDRWEKETRPEIRSGFAEKREQNINNLYNSRNAASTGLNNTRSGESKGPKAKLLEGIKSEVSNNEAWGEASSWKKRLNDGIEARERERSENSVQNQDPQQLSENRSNEEKAQDSNQPTQVTRDQELTADNKYMNDLCPDEDKMDALRKAREAELEKMIKRTEQLPPDEYTQDDPSWREH